MRRRLGVLGTATWVLLTAAVVIAGPAEARRNVGGTVPQGSECVRPGLVVLSDRAAENVACVCISNSAGVFRNVGTRGPAADVCPAPLTRLKTDRSAGG